MPNFKFPLRKFQNLNFQFYNFMKQYSSNSNIIIITTYPCLYLYKHLSSLTCFSLRCSFEFPTLKMVRVKKIPKMESFSDESQRTPQLKAINVTFVGKCWWGDLNATIKKLHTKKGILKID